MATDDAVIPVWSLKADAGTLDLADAVFVEDVMPVAVDAVDEQAANVIATTVRCTAMVELETRRRFDTSMVVECNWSPLVLLIWPSTMRPQFVHSGAYSVSQSMWQSMLEPQQFAECCRAIESPSLPDFIEA